MSEGDLSLLVLCSKPFMYAWAYEILRRTLPAPERPSGWRAAGAGLARTVAGLAFGVPAASLLLRLGEAAYIPAFFAFRAILWAGIAGLVFPLLPWKRGCAFGLIGAALNLILDWTVFGGPLGVLHLSR